MIKWRYIQRSCGHVTDTGIDAHDKRLAVEQITNNLNTPCIICEILDTTGRPRSLFTAPKGVIPENTDRHVVDGTKTEKIFLGCSLA